MQYTNVYTITAKLDGKNAERAYRDASVGLPEEGQD
jgi:hypothetical protein